MRYDIEFGKWVREHPTDVSAIGINALLDEIDRLTAEVEKHRWISVKEKLPEVVYGGSVEYPNSKPIVSDELLVAFRRTDGIFYSRRLARYWKKYGWVYETKKEKIITFEELGFIVDYFCELRSLPEPPKEDA